MTIQIRAVFEKGMLRPLEAVDLVEGQEIALVILTERERALAALGDMIVRPILTAEDEEEIDEEALMREIDEAFRGQPPISEAIIEERRNGP